MNSAIRDLKNSLGMGARTNKYRIMIPKLVGFGVDNETPNILVKNTTMPGRSFADVDLWVQGRQLTIAGDSLYDGSWSCTFYDTEEHKLRKAFKNWMDYIDSFDKHSRSATNAASYMTTIKIEQLSTINNMPTASVNLQNAYVKSISEISYADDNSSIVEFTAEFNFSHWV